MPKYLLAVALIVAAPVVLADPPPPAPPAYVAGANRLELRYAGGEMEIDDEVEGDFKFKDSDGMDVRASAQMGPQMFLRGEFAHSSSDTVRFEHQDFDLDSNNTFFRAGPGYQWSLGRTWIYAAVEFLHIKLEAEDEGDSGNGAIISGGFKDDGMGRFIWNVEIGLARVEDTDGGAFEFTLGWRVTPRFSILFGGQSMGFGDKDEDGEELSIAYGTLGAGYAF